MLVLQEEYKSRKKQISQDKFLDIPGRCGGWAQADRRFPAVNRPVKPDDNIPVQPPESEDHQHDLTVNSIPAYHSLNMDENRCRCSLMSLPLLSYMRRFFPYG
jgi:hypothetical protein